MHFSSDTSLAIRTYTEDRETPGCDGVWSHALKAAWRMVQEISKIVGDMWQKALPDQKAPYIEQVSPCFKLSAAVS